MSESLLYLQKSLSMSFPLQFSVPLPLLHRVHQILTKSPVCQVPGAHWFTSTQYRGPTPAHQVQSTVLKQLHFCPSGISKHERLSILVQPALSTNHALIYTREIYGMKWENASDKKEAVSLAPL